MKRILAAIISLAFPILAVASSPLGSDSFRRWQDDKFSMFIHFGLYSYYGGVWDGKPVTSGYSEQIQSHAGIFSDWYSSAAQDFDPVEFDADGIASLAVSAGMRSIVFTSKHHDGFCMFDTATTGYDSVDMTPSGRDYVRELSDACRKAGLRFGLYFSLIDWNYPHAYPISSHNADFITDEHHQFNMEQIRELLTGYGDISELWFDMGSLTPCQSRELYELVHELQPGCMVSGRLGNDMYDFAVMPDNFYPDAALQAPWQCAASMFNETWSWRSWQERGKVEDKAAEKLRSLINVVAHGGNYLLNIGPADDGSVVPFEKDVLISIGKWLEKEGDAIYGVEASPFRDEFEWGAVTMKDNALNLILSGSFPASGVASLPSMGTRVKKVLTPGADVSVRKGNINVALDENMYSDPLDIRVIRLELDRDLSEMHHYGQVSSDAILTTADAMCDHSYSCFDYYSNYKSTVAYSWALDVSKSKSLTLCYSDAEKGSRISLEVNGVEREVVLDSEVDASLPVAECSVGPARYSRMRGGVFNGPSSWKAYSSQELEAMAPIEADSYSAPVPAFSNHILIREIEVTEAGFAAIGICGGNGVELVLDGESVMKHLNPYRTARKMENVVVYLEEGVHQIALRAYNRFENEIDICLRLSELKMYGVDVPLDKDLMVGTCRLKVSNPDLPSVHTDSGLHNLIFRNNR